MSRETLERMALAMHDKNEDDQTLIQYSICVNSCAATYLWNLPVEGQSVGMQHALDRSREDYMRRALTALNYISILEKPSLSLLQALLTGVSDRVIPGKKRLLTGSRSCYFRSSVKRRHAGSSHPMRVESV